MITQEKEDFEVLSENDRRQVSPNAIYAHVYEAEISCVALGYYCPVYCYPILRDFPGGSLRD